MHDTHDEVIDQIIILLGNNLLDNSDNLIWLSPVTTNKLIELIKALDKVIDIYNSHSLNVIEIISLRKRLINIQQKRNQGYKFEVLINEINGIIYTLNNLKYEKETEIVGKGFETVAQAVPAYYLRNKIVKRLFETTDPSLIGLYETRFNTYVRIMNSIHPNFSLWPSTLRIVKKKVSNNTIIYVCYHIQERFDSRYIIRDVIERIEDDNTFLRMFDTLVQICLRITSHNISNKDNVSADMDRRNLLLFADGNQFKFYYFDYNNPLLRTGNEGNSILKEFLVLMNSKGIRARLNRAALLTVFNVLFTKRGLLEKVANNCFFVYKRRSKLLKKRMEEIISMRVAEFSFPDNIANILNSVRISYFVFNVIHGGSADLIERNN